MTNERQAGKLLQQMPGEAASGAPEDCRLTNNGDCDWPLDHAFASGRRGAWPNTGLKQSSIKSQAELEDARALLNCIAEGDCSAFWNLWQSYQKYLFAICFRLMGGIHADAEDALSRAMLKALDKLPMHARSIINPGAWLTRLTYNVCIEIHREHSRRRGKLNSQREALMYYHRMTCLIRSPEEDFLHDELCTFLARIVDQFPTKLREPFILHFGHEMPYREVAEQLMLSPENVRKRIQKARAILRGELKKYLFCMITAREANQILRRTCGLNPLLQAQRREMRKNADISACFR